jgi:hypothetical protein
MGKVVTLPAGPALFHEEQRFRQPWIILLILGLAALIWYAAWQQLVLRNPFGDNPAPDTVMVAIWLLFGIGMPLFFYGLRLVAEVRMDGLYFRFHLFQWRWRHLRWEDLEAAEAITYHPLRDYGGWGIRVGTKGTAYIVSGNRGLHLKRRKGSDLLLGSQRPEQFIEALHATGHLREGKIVV